MGICFGFWDVCIGKFLGERAEGWEGVSSSAYWLSKLISKLLASNSTGCSITNE